MKRVRDGAFNHQLKKCPSPLFVDPLFDDSTNQGPTNYRTGTMGTDGCIELPTGLDNKFTETHNGSMDAIGWHKIWARHAPYAQNDYRLLGDNWNYYIEDPVQIELYDVPWCDPIRTHTPDVPCFEYCVTPLEEPCLDQNCQFGRMTQLDTNKHGKFGLYFDTKSHGGDNFQFRASNAYCFIWGLEDCIVSEPPEIFTVWRKIGIDYAWMEDRNGQYTSDYPCDIIGYDGHVWYIMSELTKQWDEYHGIHKINQGNFDDIGGVFDDCFIEIVKIAQYLPNPEYRLSLTGGSSAITQYGNTTGWRPNPLLDTVMLIGIDHIDAECPSGNLGCAPFRLDDLIPGRYDNFYNFVAVGNEQDKYGFSISRYLNRDDNTTIDDALLQTASHEITHTISELDDDFFHTNFTYGLMSYDDPRSYLHDGSIILLRSSLPYFDTTNY